MKCARSVNKAAFDGTLVSMTPRHAGFGEGVEEEDRHRNGRGRRWRRGAAEQRSQAESVEQLIVEVHYYHDGDAEGR